ncbi:MAG: membrane integrity-associated transporter subunit PqiC [Burkholderiales bacterium]|nr:membrane integrity-associated transporter subunit PqiC [Burkholderiales bacterium]
MSPPRTPWPARATSLAAALLCAACALAPALPPPAVYSLAPQPPTPPAAAGGDAAAPALQVDAVPWLDGTAMRYRLDYADPARLWSFRDSRWAAPPAALLAERLQDRALRAAATGPSQAPAPLPAARPPLLRLTLEEFCQDFDTPAHSRAVLRLRARLLDPADGRVLRQHRFAVEVAAPSADARGGVEALSRAADTAIDQVLAWAGPG